jgi:hypothetical protein
MPWLSALASAADFPIEYLNKRLQVCRTTATKAPRVLLKSEAW